MEVSIKHRVYGVRILCLFLLLFLLSFFLFFFFSFLHFLKTGKVNPSPPSPKPACPYFGKCGNLWTVPELIEFAKAKRGHGASGNSGGQLSKPYRLNNISEHRAGDGSVHSHSGYPVSIDSRIANSDDKVC